MWGICMLRPLHTFQKSGDAGWPPAPLSALLKFLHRDYVTPLICFSWCSVLLQSSLVVA